MTSPKLADNGVMKLTHRSLINYSGTDGIVDAGVNGYCLPWVCRHTINRNELTHGKESWFMILNKKDFADLIGYNVASISNFMRDGMPHETEGRQGGRVRIDTAKAIPWLIEDQIKKKVKDVENLKSAPNKTRDKLTEEQLRKLQIENDEKESKLVPIDEVSVIFNEAIVTVASLLDGAAGKMAAGDSVLRQRLLDEHRRIREVFANQLQTYTCAKTRGKSDDAPAEPSSVEMGTGEANTPGWLC